MFSRPSLWTAVDLVLAFVGYVVVLFGVTAIAISALLPPDPYSQLPVFALVALLAVPPAVWHVWTGRSLAPLGEFIFTVAVIQALLFVVVVPLFFLLVGLEVQFSLSPFAGLVYGAVLYGGAYYLVYREGWETVKARIYQLR